MVDLTSTILIIILNVNGLIYQIKRQKLSDIENARLKYMINVSIWNCFLAFWRDLYISQNYDRSAKLHHNLKSTSTWMLASSLASCPCWLGGGGRGCPPSRLLFPPPLPGGKTRREGIPQSMAPGVGFLPLGPVGSFRGLEGPFILTGMRMGQRE